LRAMSAQIRASYTKVGLRNFKRAYADQLEQLIEIAGRDALADLRAASALEWLPAELHGAVADAMIEVVGRSNARALWADVLIEAFSSPVLSPIVSGALRIYGKQPPSLMRMTPHAWALFFRDCGRSWMEPAEGSRATMMFERLPRAVVASTGILDSFQANCDAALRYTGFAGSVTAAYELLGDARFSIDVQWQAANAS
jgi:hypothetical protein